MPNTLRHEGKHIVACSLAVARAWVPSLPSSPGPLELGRTGGLRHACREAQMPSAGPSMTRIGSGGAGAQRWYELDAVVTLVLVLPPPAAASEGIQAAELLASGVQGRLRSGGCSAHASALKAALAVLCASKRAAAAASCVQ